MYLLPAGKLNSAIFVSALRSTISVKKTIENVNSVTAAIEKEFAVTLGPGLTMTSMEK